MIMVIIHTGNSEGTIALKRKENKFHLDMLIRAHLCCIGIGCMGLLGLTGEARAVANNRLRANVRCQSIGLSNRTLWENRRPAQNPEDYDI